jgi:hypothetical protein
MRFSVATECNADPERAKNQIRPGGRSRRLQWQGKRTQFMASDGLEGGESREPDTSAA